MVAHPPRFGGKVASFDATEARAVPGVVDVKQIPTGVAVYANGIVAGDARAASALQITWDDSGAEKRGSRAARSTTTARSRAQPGTVAGAHGNAEARVGQRPRR